MNDMLEDLKIMNKVWRLSEGAFYHKKLPLRYMVVLSPADTDPPDPYCHGDGYRWWHKRLDAVTESDAERWVEKARIDGLESSVFRDYEFQQREVDEDWSALKSFMSAVDRMCTLSNIERPDYIKIMYKIKMS